MKTVIKIGSDHYLVSTVEVYAIGWETMVFRCDPEGEVTNWRELYGVRYRNEFDATAGHSRVCSQFEP
jgi:hypothetical protein